MNAYEARRKLLAQKTGLDNSPKILEYGKVWWEGSLVTSASGNHSTVLYHFPVATQKRYIESYGLANRTNIFKDNGLTYVEYWSGTVNPQIPVGCDTIGFSINKNLVNESYAYFTDTGEIIFAGINSVYHGHKNISELN